MDEERLAEIEARLKAAEPGPWTWSKIGKHVPAAVRHVWQDPKGRVTLFVATCDSANTDNDANAAFIAAAPTDVAALLAEVRRLQPLARLGQELRDIGFGAE